MKKACLISLGCPRNLLDSEVLLGLLEKNGFSVSETPEGVDVAIVNTCGFIDDAKQESVNVILQLAEMKRRGKIKRLIVSGCLPQRYPAELLDEIKEIDAVFGTSDFVKIPELMDKLTGERVREVSENPGFLYDHGYSRKLLTARHYAYVKIQEGCSNRCSYCVIPSLKGPRRSRTISSVLEEVKILKKERDIRELIVIGQDTTSFGLDRAKGSELPELLAALSGAMKDGWVRLLYTHPVHFTEKLMEVIASRDNICDYVDLPIQHINDRVLKAMNRRHTKKEVIDLIAKLRYKIKDVVLRTSVIVGFPGETEEEFSELIDFLSETKFDRLGAFVYSREDGTPAAGMKDQVPENAKKERFGRVMELQQKVSAENNLKYYGRVEKVLIDEKGESPDGEYVGRGRMDAPEVDGVIYVKGKGLKIGEFHDVRITGAMEYDLLGEAI